MIRSLSVLAVVAALTAYSPPANAAPEGVPCTAVMLDEEFNLVVDDPSNEFALVSGGPVVQREIANPDQLVCVLYYGLDADGTHAGIATADGRVRTVPGTAVGVVSFVGPTLTHYTRFPGESIFVCSQLHWYVTGAARYFYDVPTATWRLNDPGARCAPVAEWVTHEL